MFVVVRSSVSASSFDTVLAICLEPWFPGVNQAINQANQVNQAINQADSQVDNQAELDDLEKRIIAVIKMNPKLSQKKIARIVEERHSIVKYNMEKMKKKGIITRVGSSQKGEWTVHD